MLAFNEALQKPGKPTTVRFSRVGYFQLGAILVLLTEKADTTKLLKIQTNVLMWAVKTVDQAIIDTKTLECWHRLKVYEMSLERYFGKEKMVLFRREIESSTGI